jgi:tetratricopeptide (TPR) repeat protein
MRLPVRIVAVMIAAVLLGAAAGAGAGDRLAEALRLYDDAMYTRALELLDQLAADQPSAGVHQYRALCYIALGRADAAERAMADIVATDPFFALDADVASPRVAAQFATVRRRLLPPLIRRGFADATARYREGATDRARQQFAQVMKLLDDPALQNDQALSDLALIAGAFVELTRAQTPPPTIVPIARSIVAATQPPSLPAAAADLAPAPAAIVAPAPPAAVPTVLASPAPAPMRVTASEPVAYEPAIAIVRPLPKWIPPDPNAAQRKYAGTIAVEIDARGRVVNAATKRIIHPAYDPVVLAAAYNWVFQPARQNGRPVKSEVMIDIELLPVAAN